MQLSEVTRFTDDVPATTEFYGELTGEQPVAEGEGIAIFAVDGVQLLIHENYDADEGALPAEDHVSFAVESVDEAFETLTDRGLDAFREPAEYDWGRSAYLRDPDGRLVELAER